MNKFYVYVHRRLSDSLPFYVGKGSGKRAWSSDKRNDYWHNTKNKHGILIEIVFENLTEEEAFQCEIDTILEFNYFSFPLTNLTAGGEGCSGMVFSDKQRLNIANGLKYKRYLGNSKSETIIKRPCACGNNNHNADLTEYTFVRLLDGEEFTGTRHDLCSEFNVNRESIKKLFYKSGRKSAGGWRLIKDIKNE